MIYRPMTMCAPMALAFREGRKTETRRTIRPQPTGDFGPIGSVWYDNDGEGRIYAATYRPGDGVWVREPIQAVWDGGYIRAVYRADEARSAHRWTWKVLSLAGLYMPKSLCRTLGECLEVRAEKLQEITEEGAIAEGLPTRDHGCVCGPDEFREGVRFCGHCGKRIVDWVEEYRELWRTLHPKAGEQWDDNPWVFVYRLKLLTTDHQEAQRLLAKGE